MLFDKPWAPQYTVADSREDQYPKTKVAFTYFSHASINRQKSYDKNIKQLKPITRCGEQNCFERLNLSAQDWMTYYEWQEYSMEKFTIEWGVDLYSEVVTVNLWKETTGIETERSWESQRT